MSRAGSLRWDEAAFADHAAKRSRWTTATAPSKYNAVKTNGYASKKEANRAAALRILQDGGQIRNLMEQVPYVLIPRQLGPGGEVAERACKIVVDFTYEERTRDGWLFVAEDTKGFKTPDYIIKRKLLRFAHGIVIRES